VQVLTTDQWISLMHASVSSSTRRDILLYVHGYNVSFDDAARRTAQLAYDLTFDGPAAFFSWPSRGTLEGYVADEDAASQSIPNILAFLQLLLRSPEVRRVHIIAHSLGARPLTNALLQLAPEESARIGEVILAAPDINAEVFTTQIAPQLGGHGTRVTMYSSSKDRALEASAKFHAFPRAGMSGQWLLVLPPLETIDASRVDTDWLGHSYYASTKEVIDDLFLIVAHEAPASSRNLLAATRGGLRYWRLP
jgi:esterase/lipase superfamily enzyme